MIRTYLNAFQIGIVAGMRAMSAPAFVSHKLSRETPNPLPDSKFHFLTSSKAANTLAVLAGGELIGDKMPNAPSRIAPAQLPFRLISGAASGAALTEADGQPVAYGAVLGAVGAAVGSFAFYHLRHWLTHEKDLPDTVVALAEDALTMGLGLLTINE
ncbi:DUF4126 family protein [Spirosoma pollinicola]|uniref:DUF4126 domain-containing protein n=1 Tax=Spirosoma pollinicola TaxID=2057025 RepID=A0A2K8YU55_9BACT|nr:DUF4126 family protein [Spirosoma pollinicola]AUD01175.1 DUF4126 domain-containing protein [Spirosoma pollinicola]